ncbi:PIN domain-containing protein [Actinoplanes awajinensis]|uniref:PIN domain-containing protein n=1 Tax=Actinoplanes awajinensis TaxID=135946 RepID=UPI000A01AE07|nr:PIN domain-containing protein [Actinoplanes awajinensis]
MIVLDTNIVSELMRAEPDPAVLAWLRQSFGIGLYTTAVTVAEIRYGIARLPGGQRRDRLYQAADEVFAAFPRQVLPFDLAAANTRSCPALTAPHGGRQPAASPRPFFSGASRQAARQQPRPGPPEPGPMDRPRSS